MRAVLATESDSRKSNSQGKQNAKFLKREDDRICDWASSLKLLCRLIKPPQLLNGIPVQRVSQKIASLQNVRKSIPDIAA